MRRQPLHILCPSRHLGCIPAEEYSFRMGTETKPDYYCCHSGSIPNDPASLGMDTSLSLYQWQKHDLELMLLSSRRQEVPMMISSAGDTGTNSRVDLYVSLIQRLAWQHNLPSFKLVYFYSEISKETLRLWMEKEVPIEGLVRKKPLTIEELEQTERIVAVAKTQPFIEALESGADVIIGGRGDPAAVFASAAMYKGFSEHAAYSFGHTFYMSPAGAESLRNNETIIGTLTPENETVTMQNPGKTDSSVIHSRHTLKEHLSPWKEKIITLEGSGKIGERFIAILEVKDPRVIPHIDTRLKWVQQRITARFPGKNYRLSCKAFEKDKAIGDIETENSCLSYERSLLLEGIAETEQLAEELTLLGSRQLVAAPSPGQSQEMETPPIVIRELFPAPPAYHWTIQHTFQQDERANLFQLRELVVE